MVCANSCVLSLTNKTEKIFAHCANKSYSLRQPGQYIILIRNRAVRRLCKVGQLCVNKLDVKWLRACVRAKFLRPRPLITIPRPLLAVPGEETLTLLSGNLRCSSKFAIAIVLTKQTMGVTVIIRVIIPGSKVTVQEKVGRLKPPQPPRF